MKEKKILMKVFMILGIFLICMTTVSTVQAAEEKVVVRGAAAYDTAGNRLVLKGKTMSLGPAQGVYNDLIISTEWFTSNASVMKITDGKYKSECMVKAVGTGTCVVDGVTESELRWPNYDYQIMHNEHKFRVVEKVKSLTVSSKATVYVGKSKKLNYQTKPSNVYSQYMSGLSFKSSNKNIVTVDGNGKITGKKPGTATITIKTDNGLKKTCKITVKRPALKSLKISKSKMILEQGKSQVLKISYVPEEAYAKVTWSSNNKKVAAVSSKGKVTAKKAGVATITAKTSTGIKVTCKVTVAKKPTSVKLNKTKTELSRGKTYTLKATFKPNGAYAKITWSSSNKSVATVSSSGKITAKKVGTATITAKTSNGKKATCKVTVVRPLINKISLSATELELWEAETATLSYKKTPSDGRGTITYSSSNTSVATVSSNGKIVAKKAGETVITAKASSKVQVKCKVIVKSRPSATGVSIENGRSPLMVGEELQLETEVYPEESRDEVQWESDNTDIATVSAEGKVTPKSSGVVNITASAGTAKSSEVILITEGPWLDLSKGAITVYDNYAVQNEERISFDAEKTLTIVQSYGENGITFAGAGDVRVVFADLTLKSNYVFFAGDETTTNVTIENLQGARNTFSTSTNCFKGMGYHTLTFQGDGDMSFRAAKGSAFVGGNIIFKEGWSQFDINYGEVKPVIECESLTILEGAEVETWGASKPYSCTNTVSIATGTLYYQGALYK